MKKGLFLAFVVGIWAAPVDAAVVYLKDGSVVRGTIVSATARDIQIHSPQGGLQTFSTDRITRVDYAEGESEASPVPRARRAPRTQEQIINEDAAVWQNGQQQSLSFALGAGVPFSQVDFGSIDGGRATNGGAGIYFSPQYLFKVGPQLSAGFQMDYVNRSQRTSENLLPFSETWVSGNNLAFMPVLKYSFVERGFGRPYVLAGAGVQRSSTKIEAQPHIGFVWDDTNTEEPRTLVDDAHWGLGSTIRLGIDFSWIESSVLGVEIGWNHSTNASFDPTPAGKKLELAPISGIQNSMVVVMRWGWRF